MSDQMKRKKQSAIMIINTVVIDIDEPEAADFDKKLENLNEDNYAAPDQCKRDQRWL